MKKGGVVIHAGGLGGVLLFVGVVEVGREVD